MDKASGPEGDLQWLRNQHRSILSALDRMDIGICIANLAGNINVTNERARHTITENRGITLDQDRLLSSDENRIDAAIRSAIEKFKQDFAYSRKSENVVLSVAKVSSERPYIVEISPLQDEPDVLNLTGLLITILDPDKAAPMKLSWCVAAFGLSKAEADVARLLLNGLATRTIASERNVSPETVKTQIGSIMYKTGTKNRQDLIRTLMRTSPPINSR